MKLKLIKVLLASSFKALHSFVTLLFVPSLLYLTPPSLSSLVILIALSPSIIIVPVLLLASSLQQLFFVLPLSSVYLLLPVFVAALDFVIRTSSVPLIPLVISGFATALRVLLSVKLPSNAVSDQRQT